MAQLEIIYFAIIRFVLPCIAVLILSIGLKSIFHKLKRKTLARFAVESYRDVVEIKSAESIIGSGRLCDVRLKSDSVQKQHAVLQLTDHGFKITPVNRENKVFVNNYLVEDEAYLESGDKIRIGSTVLQIAVNPAINRAATVKADKSARQCRICSTILLTVFQLLCCISYVLHSPETAIKTVAVFGAMVLFQWIYLPIRGFSTDVGVEIVAFFLTTVGFCLSAGVDPDSIVKKAAFFACGMVLFLIMSALLSHWEAVEKLQVPAAVFGLLLLAVNIIFGKAIFGSQNWIIIGDVFSFQPSEFVKVIMVFISACALDKMLQIKSIMSFLAFVFICLLALAYIRDFGTAAIYFVTMLIILCLRMCDIKIVAALSAAAVLGSTVIIKLMPYVSARFSTYRHAWEYASSGGFQQTRTMVAIASGGLFGLGPANGNLKYIPAADTDLVFGMIAEEFGLIFAICTVLCFVLMVIYAAICIPRTQSVYYAVTGGAVTCIFLLQASLNLFGSVDLLPLTGVTMPFISNGGSSILSSWMLLAFLKVDGAKIVTLGTKGGR